MPPPFEPLTNETANNGTGFAILPVGMPVLQAGSYSLDSLTSYRRLPISSEESRIFVQPRQWILELAVAVALAFFGSERLTAQRYTYRQYGPQQGLTNLVVYCLQQDRAGYLWVGTDNGLFRYDGTGFQGYFRADGLPSQVIRNITESPAGELWVSTDSGIARRAGNQFLPVAQDSNFKPVNGLGLVFDRAGNFFFVRSGTGELVRGSLAAGDGIRYSTFAPGPITGIHSDSDGENLWCLRETGLTRLRWNGTALETYGITAGLPVDRWTAMTEDAEGNVWVRSESRLFVLPRGKTRFENRSGEVPHCSAGMCRLSSDQREGVLVPGDTGLEIVGKTAGIRLDAAHGLPAEAVRAAIVTRDGSLWIGTFGGGLVRRLGRGEWISWQREDGFPNTTFWAVQGDEQGSTWLGGNGGLNRLDRNGKVTGNWTTREGLAGNRVEWIAQPPGAPILYASTKPFGIAQIDIPTGRVIRNYGPGRFGAGKPSAPPIATDSNGQLWVTTERLCFRSTKSAASAKELQFSPVARSGLPEDARFTGAPLTSKSRTGDMLIGTSRGLARYLQAEDRWLLYNSQDGLRDSPVASALDGDGVTWIRYSDSLGLTRLTWNPATGKPAGAQHFDRSSGLVSDAVFGMVVDRDGRLWVSTDNGVDVRSPAGSWRHFSVADGLISGDCDEGALFAEGNSVWVGTSNGVSRYTERGIPETETDPLMFSSVEGGGRTWQASTDKPELPYDRRSIRIQLGSPDFFRESLLIRYRLAGEESVWIETRERSIQYSSLPAGSHRFEAVAVRADGGNTKPVSLEFAIERPWWQTWWFQSLCLLGAGLLAKAVWRMRMRVLLSQRDSLEKEVAQRTAELRESHRQLEEIAYLDSMTLLPNRRAFAGEFERRLALGHRHEESFALVLIDLDQFKPVNDNYGHDAGDAVLVEMSRRMLEAVRAGDFVARLGGDEFGLLLARAATQPDVDLVCQRIEQCFERPVTFQGFSLRVGLSTGVAIFPAHGRTQEQLFKAADIALYETKRQHRHTI